MATENIRREPLPVRMPGQAAEAEPASGAAPVTRLRCPSCSAEMTSVVEHALVSDRGDGPVRWTSEAEVMTATLRGLRESLASVSPPGGVEVTDALPTSSEQPHLRLVPPVDEAGAEAPPTEVAEPATGPEDVAEQESPATDAAPANSTAALLPRERAYGIQRCKDVGTWLIASSDWRATVTGYDQEYLMKGGHATGSELRPRDVS